MSHNLDVYMPVLILAGFATIMFVGALLVGKLLRPNNPTELKLEPYECGEEPVGTAWSNFNVRFYVVALIFIIFDVEIAFMYPVTAIFKDLLHEGWGVLAFIEIAIFVLILMVGFVYAWSQGGLDWVREYATPKKSTID